MISILVTAMIALVSAPTYSILAFSTTPHLPLARVIHLNSRSGITSSSSMQMAQKMTPTRKTRRDDSFSRDAEDEEEKKGELFVLHTKLRA